MTDGSWTEIAERWRKILKSALSSVDLMCVGPGDTHVKQATIAREATIALATAERMANQEQTTNGILETIQRNFAQQMAERGEEPKMTYDDGGICSAMMERGRLIDHLHEKDNYASPRWMYARAVDEYCEGARIVRVDGKPTLVKDTPLPEGAKDREEVPEGVYCPECNYVLSDGRCPKCSPPDEKPPVVCPGGLNDFIDFYERQKTGDTTAEEDAAWSGFLSLFGPHAPDEPCEHDPCQMTWHRESTNILDVRCFKCGEKCDTRKESHDTTT